MKLKGCARSLALCMLCLLGLGLSAQAQDLRISLSDLRIEQSAEGGYYLYIRKKPGIESILLVESTEDPERQTASYTLRNPNFHPENGSEERILDGEVLEREGYYFLVDSSPVADPEFGTAFRIFIPYVIEYGYPWSRNGELQMLDGSYINVRSFELPFANYAGAFQDNPFVIRLTQSAFEGPPEGNFIDDTADSFNSIAQRTEGLTLYSEGREDILSDIARILSNDAGNLLDLVLVIDSTQSMKNDVAFLRSRLPQIIGDNTRAFRSIRVGFVFYRDYMEDYLYKTFDFQAGTRHVQGILNQVNPAGGRDIPEAVNEGLYAALSEFDWRADIRKIILIGDAPPHPRPRGEVTAELVEQSAENLTVSVNSIILPH